MLIIPLIEGVNKRNHLSCIYHKKFKIRKTKLMLKANTAKETFIIISKKLTPGQIWFLNTSKLYLEERKLLSANYFSIWILYLLMKIAGNSSNQNWSGVKFWLSMILSSFAVFVFFAYLLYSCETYYSNIWIICL